jgi:hypothetical protein
LEFPEGSLRVVPSYSYVAVSGGTAKRGYIEARNDGHARVLLSSLGLQVQEVRKVEVPPTGSPSFSFHARKGSGKEVRGIIESLTANEAKRRLKEDYDLKVESLSPVSAGASPRACAERDGVLLYCAEKPQSRHSPLLHLRLMSGWLLFFYAAAAALGAYQVKAFEGLLSSPLLFLSLLSISLFLLLSGIRVQGRRRRCIVAAFGVLMVVLAGMAY